MAEEILVVVTGSDRPGIMDELSQFLLNCGGNIIDSRTALLRGRFAILLLVQGELSVTQRIRDGLQTMQALGAEVSLHAPTQEVKPDQSAFPYVFVASGKDQAGVLHRISHLLRVLNINIDNMKTRVATDRTFEIRLHLAVPRETPIAMLRDYLTYLCTELGITGELKEV